MDGTVAPLGSQTSLREVNSARVVATVKKFGHLTQVELAAATGLSPATISNIVKQLASQGVVETRNTVRSGRRAQMVTLARTTGLAVGIYIGRRTLRVDIADATQTITADQVLPLPVDHRADTTLDRAALIVMELTEGLGAQLSEVIGIGVALPAPVSPSTHRISVRGIMRGWEDIDVGEVLARRLNLPVLVENDANSGAVAEARYGALRGFSDGVYVRASYQMGAGILIGGRLHRGPEGTAGEIGHVQVDPQGAICQCGGRGCLNTVVGADALVDLLRVSRGALSLRDVISLATEGDPGCRQVIADAGTAIGSAIADLAVTINPGAIAVGGELAEAGETLLAPMRDVLRARPVLATAGIDVLPAVLGSHAESLGAFALAMDAFDEAGLIAGAGPGTGPGGPERPRSAAASNQMTTPAPATPDIPLREA
ncbi:ROK family transcriptional regulator [Actinomyces provencensis]|uniref:ROK family transcriptional regulator n=1 Tax=Actinomyces provencensis TaxID=1720198 RepID=UPI00096AA385|nr:ROK family transcriptional regulator [Actinomyces provencensis]